MGTLNQSLIEWGVAGRALPGQRETGDHHLVKVCPTEALVGVVDGLGHGEGAAAAAKLAIATLEKGHGESPIALIQRCHEELRSTRGVVMSLAMFQAEDNTMTWLGVGNVEGFLLHRNAYIVPGQEALLLRGGVVGDHLPRLSASIIEVGPGIFSSLRRMVSSKGLRTMSTCRRVRTKLPIGS